MSEEFDDIQEEPLDEEQNPEEEQALDENAQPTGKFTRLLGSDSRKFKLSGMFKDWFLDYSGDAVPPARRRVHPGRPRAAGPEGLRGGLPGKLGQHPHRRLQRRGPIHRGAALEVRQGSDLRPEGHELDDLLRRPQPGADGAPTELPVRFPLLLAQGTEGIAVGMQSRILPHNFNELIDASVAILKEEPYELYPDFPTGGLADCSKYNHGRRGGQVKIRARIEKVDKSTVTISEIP